MTLKSQMAAIALAAAISQPAIAKGTVPVPFWGTYVSSENQSGGTFPVFVQVLGGRGQASYLGRFKIEAEWRVNVQTFDAVGTFTLTAANGDTLVGTATGKAAVIGEFAYITETCFITGGTGRFVNAKGGFVTARVLGLAPGSTERSEASFHGTITLR
jgi:hypothetical protein